LAACFPLVEGPQPWSGETSNHIANGRLSGFIRASLAFEGMAATGVAGCSRPTIIRGHIMPIRRYLDDQNTFDPDAITAMSDALEQACKALRINGQAHHREIVAERIISLARSGLLDAKALSERVIAETKAMRSL
jgi:hypothetical protein